MRKINCPKCGAPNAAFVDEKGRTRSERRKTHGGMRKGRAKAWNDKTTLDKIKCKKCGVFDG